jgi:predicted transcriptional regulator YheO
MQGAAAPAVPSVGSEFIGSMLDSLPERPTRRERLELIAFLEKKNVFAMRGALDLVATRLGVANVTVYSDIRYVKTHPEEFATS